MYISFIHTRACYFFNGLLFLCSIFFYSLANAATVEKSNGNTEDSYQIALQQAFQELSENSAFKLNSADIESLLQQASAADKNKKPEQVLGLLNNNMSVIKSNYKNKQIVELVKLALANHSLGTAKRIRSELESQASRAIIASCDYEIINYLSNQQAWDEALALLKNIDINSDLSSSNADKASIIWGAALQHTKKHRQAIEYYQHIKPESPAYALAQLNLALVYIRQDWWTDAQIAMQNSIKANNEKDIEFNNRVYTTLGFSQLQQGFYRNARESFRNVKIKSEYADQALLGLGMAALNQEDFLGAFNAFDQLKKHPKQNSPVEQSYLMSAFTLTKLKQNKSAANAYAEAQVYYENKVNLFSNTLNQINTTTNYDWKNIGDFFAQQNIKESPDNMALNTQLRVLERLLGYPVSDKTKSAISSVYSQIWTTYQSNSKAEIEKKIANFNSYLNQSRFGLTKLYDTP